jgi:uncharacterized membrane protein (UPF0182 family)
MTSVSTAATRRRHRQARAARVAVWRTPRVRSLLALSITAVCAGVIVVAARVYTDLLWFRELGHERVLLTMLGWKILARGVVGIGTTAFVLANLVAAERIMRASGQLADERILVAIRRAIAPLRTGAAVLCGALATGAQHEGAWKLLLLWTHRRDFGVSDPLFGRDVGFYVFSLPLYRHVAGWLLTALVMAVIATAAMYLVMGGPRVWRCVIADRRVRAHALALGALVLLVVAWRLRLQQLAMAVPHDVSRVPGPSYTDIHVRSPLMEALALVAVGGAVLCAVTAVRRVQPVVVAALLLSATVLSLAHGEIPELVDRIAVQPQELTRERPHIADAIAFTRRAYGLDAVDVRSVSGERRLTADDIQRNARTLENVPLWDDDVLRPALNDLQSIGRYFRFPNETAARVTVHGRERLMTVAARQLDIERLTPDERGWATSRFAYTHGYGVVAAYAGAIDSEREPRFAQREFELRDNLLGLRQPRIYYGEDADDDPPYLIVNSKREEVDEPVPGSRAPSYHYTGSGGIALSSLLRRAAFAARLGDPKLLLTETVTPRSRILLHRDVRERVVGVAPFLHWDATPQTTVVGGRVQFIFHGYTTSDTFPYAARLRMGDDRIDYVREAAIAAVDGFDGHVTIYAAGTPDPILRAWRAAFPGLFLPDSRMPADLRSQLRYPEELFSTQAKALRTYHAEDPSSFWNGTDAWQQPEQLAGPIERVGEVRFPDPEHGVDPDERREHGVSPESWRLKPEYLMARLPGDATERFMLATPFTPRGGQNLVSYLAGTRDAGGRPALTLVSLPRDRVAIGPTQATRRILANPGVDDRLQLLNRESRDLGRASVNRTVLGAPRVVPLAGALVHVQPLYLTSAGGGLPALQMVTVLVNGRVGYGATLRSALLRAVRASSARG